MTRNGREVGAHHDGLGARLGLAAADREHGAYVAARGGVLGDAGERDGVRLVADDVLAAVQPGPPQVVQVQR